MRRWRKLISVIMLMVMLGTLIPSGALAAEAPTGSTETETAAVEEPQETNAGETIQAEPEADETESAAEGVSVVENAAEADSTAMNTQEEENTEDAPVGETSVEVAPVEEAVRKEAKEAGPVGLEPYINEIILKYKDPGASAWKDYNDENDPLDNGDDVHITVKYSIEEGKIYCNTDEEGNITEESRTVTYNLPSVVKVSKAIDGVVSDSSGNAVGTLHIDTDGATTIVFSESFAKSTKGSIVNGSFYFEATTIREPGPDPEPFNFGGKTDDFEIIDSTWVDHDIKVTKTNSEPSFRESDGAYTTTYTIIVSSDHGTDGKVNVTDNVSTTNSSNYRYSYNNLKVVDSSGNPVDITGLVSGTAPSWEIKGLPALDAGKKYTITYDAVIEQLTKEFTYSTTSQNTGTTVSNSVEATDDSVKATTSNTITVKPELRKTYETYNAGNKIYTWTVLINNNSHDITGYTYKDVMSEDMLLNSTVTITSLVDQSKKKEFRTVDFNYGNTFSYTFDDVAFWGKEALNGPFKITYRSSAGTADKDVFNTGTLIGKLTYEDQSRIAIGPSSTKTSKSATGSVKNDANKKALVMEWELKSFQMPETLSKGSSFTYWDTLGQVYKYVDENGEQVASFSDGEAVLVEGGLHYTTCKQIVDVLHSSLILTTPEGYYVYNVNGPAVDSSGRKTYCYLSKSLGDSYQPNSDVAFEIIGYDADNNEYNVSELKDNTSIKIVKFKFTITTNKDLKILHASLGENSYPKYYTSWFEYGDDLSLNATVNGGKVVSISNTLTAENNTTWSSTATHGWRNGRFLEKSSKPVIDDDKVYIDYTVVMAYDIANTGKDEFFTDIRSYTDEYSGGVGTYEKDSAKATVYYDDEMTRVAITDTTMANPVLFKVTEVNDEEGLVKFRLNFSSYPRMTARRIKITYRVRVDEDEYWNDPIHSKKIYTNSFSTAEGEVAASSTEIERETDVIRKTGKQLYQERIVDGKKVLDSDGNVILDPAPEVQYEVLINKGADDLNPVGSTAKLTDTMSSDSEFETAFSHVTLRLYDCDPKTGKKTSETKDAWDYSYDRKNKQLIVTLNDNTPYVLCYSYLLDSEVLKLMPATLHNDATLEGYSSSEDTPVEKLAAGGHAETRAIELLKVDKDSKSTRLEGAVFELQKYDTDSKKWDVIDEYTINKEGLKLDLIKLEQDGKALESDVLYRLFETKAPEHYTNITENGENVAFYFVIRAQGESEEEAQSKLSGKIPEAVEPVFFNYIGGSEIIENQQIGDLSVTKTVEGATSDNTEFTFTVTLKKGDTPVSGTFNTDKANETVTFDANGKTTFTLKHGQTKTIVGIPVGITYEVTETTAKGYVLKTKTGDTGTIKGDTKSEAKFTNKKDTGSLEIKKIVSSVLDSDKTKEFEFTVTLEKDNQPVSGTFGGVTFTNGTTTFSLKHNGTKTITGIPVGTEYTVKETSDSGFTVSPASGQFSGEISTTKASATFTNTRKTGSLTVTKTIESSTASDLTKTFTFTVTLKDGNNLVSGTFGGVTFTNGQASFNLTNNGTKTIEGLPVGISYTVKETTAAGFVTTVNGAVTAEAAGTVTEAGTTEAFINKKDEGGLVVTKAVESDLAEDAEKEFTFTLKLDPATPNETIGGVKFDANGEYKFTLKSGGSKSFTGLPIGREYTVTETGDNNFTVEPADGVINGKISASQATAAFKNTRKTGVLEVKKTVVTSIAADKNQEFEFTVQLTSAVTKTYGDVAFANGTATFKLKDGQTKTISGLPVGIGYEVTETAVDGFTLTKVNGKVAEKAEGTITTAKSSAAFENTRDTGDLEIKKTASSKLSSDMSKSFEFTVKLTKDGKPVSGTFGGVTFADDGTAVFTLKHGDTKTITGIPVGVAFTVKETADAGFTTDPSSGEITGEISKTKASAPFTNTRKTGDLEVKKSVTSSTPSDKTRAFSFKVKLTPAVSGKFGDMTFNANGEASFTLTDGQTKTATGLPTEVTYKVTEETADGFVTTPANGHTGTISTTKATAAFTNVKDEGGLAVTKEVSSDYPADATKKFSFVVKLTPVVSGTYGDMTFDENGEAKVSLAKGETATASGLPTSTRYKVTETADDNYVVTWSNQEGTIGKSTVVAKATNTRKKGDLRITKTVNSKLPSDKNEAFTFTVTLNPAISGKYGDVTFDESGKGTVSLKGGETATVSGLPVGVAYTVAETSDDRFTVAPSTGTINGSISTTAATAAFTNTRKTGDLEITKTVSSDLSTDATKKFTFTITLDPAISGKFGDVTFDESGKATVELTGGQSAAVSGLPTDIRYTVKETSDAGFTTVPSSGEISGSISTVKATAAFTNTRKTGDLEVKKSVTSSTPSDKTDKQFSFKVQLTPAVEGTYGDMTFDAKGVATFTLKHNESKTATGLPTDVTYKVTEERADGFVPTPADGCSGTISTTKSTAAFTNAKEEGGLIVSKSVVSDVTADKDKEFKFTVTLDDTSVNGEYGDMNFENGVAVVYLKHNQTKQATGLAKGIKYTVQEDKYDEFVTAPANGATGTIVEKGTCTAAFTNTRKTGSLKISKEVVTCVPAEKNAEYKFTVTLKNGNQYLNKTYSGYAFDENGKAEITVKGGTSVIIEGIPVGTTYEVAETASSKFTVEKTNASGTITVEQANVEAKIKNIRKTGNLEVSKTVVNRNTENTSREFNFTVTLSDKTISGKFGDMTFTNGVSNFTLKHGQTAVATGLPTEVTYTVAEAEEAVTDDEFETAKTGQAGEISGTASKAAFTNTYTAAGKYSPEVRKALNGRPLEKDQFTFTLTDKDGNELQAKNDAAGSVYFDDIEYDQDDMNKDEDGNLIDTDVVYTAKEVFEKKDGYTYSKEEYTITVTLHDNMDGTITATADKKPEDWVFHNTYEAAGKIELPALKKLLGERALEEGQFTFELKNETGDVVLSTKTNGADGSVLFDAIEYTQDDIYDVDENGVYSGADTKTYNYTISEVIPEGAVDNGDGTFFFKGYTYDGTVYNVAVVLTDNGDGTITAVVAGTEGGAEAGDTEAGGDAAGGTGTEGTPEDTENGENTEPGETVETEYVFANAYDANGTLKLDAVKVFDHGVIKGGEFTFELKDAEGEVLQTKTNDAKGNVSFEMLTYDMKDLAGAPYVYTVSEVAGKDENVEYDKTVYTVTVDLADNGDGTLEVTKKIDNGGELVFTNKQLNVKTSIKLGGVKVLKGSDLKDGQFTFVLSDESGKNVMKTKNDANGNFTFDEITYKLEDLKGEKKKVYIYGISEVNDKQSDIVYDEKVYTVKVTVTDIGDGTMTAVADTAIEEVKFTNSVSAKSNKTGDEAPLGVLFGGLGVGAAGLALIYEERRRKNRQK